MKYEFNPRRRFGLELEVVFEAEEWGRDDGRVDMESALYRVRDETQLDLIVDVYNYFQNTDRNDRRWYAKSDSSLSDPGCEIASPPLRGLQGIQELRQMLKGLNLWGFFADESCGLHVHHDIRGITPSQFRNIYRAYYTFQPVTTFFLNADRMYNSYCAPATKYYRTFGSRLDQQIRGIENLGRAAVNLYRWEGRDTVEFRQHHGTLREEEVIPWVLFTQAIVEYAYRTKEPQDTPLLDLCKVFRRIGWAGCALDDPLIFYARTCLEQAFERHAGHPRYSPIVLSA